MTKTSEHNNSFLAVRILAALVIIAAHHSSIRGDGEPYAPFMNGLLAQLGLSIFFALSGFVIFQSLDRSNSWTRFFTGRLLRLMPALIVAVAFTSALTLVWFGNWFNLSDHINYVLNNSAMLFHEMQWSIANIFGDRPRVDANASLWTLPYEFWLYVTLFLVFLTPRPVRAALVLTMLVALPVMAFSMPPDYYVEFGPNLKPAEFGWRGFDFFAGCALALIWPRIKRISPLIGIVAIAASYLPMLPFLQFSIFSVGLICVASLPHLKRLEILGDPSYGAYLYAFPVQQLCVISIDGWWQQLAASILIAFSLGYLSWHLIEAPIMKKRETITGFLGTTLRLGRSEA